MNNEHISMKEGFAVCLSTVGTVMVSIDATANLDAPFVPLVVNLLTPLALALSVTTLRSGVQELMGPRNRLGCTMSVAEFTCIKLTLSSCTCLIASFVLEGGGIGLSRHTGLHQSLKPPWWVALASYPPRGTALILLGGIFILIFQVNITWLARLTSSVTVGVVGGAKVVPQWLLNSAFGVGGPPTAPLAFAGAALVIAASLFYVSARMAAAPPRLPRGPSASLCILSSSPVGQRCLPREGQA
mmetsp:Transcript_103518/g.333560  ORF Transcript_103518/g.333560 Transcript_103518/m.333560 type:complete len:243 (-) Transcript_103518:353-1081(-)